MLVADLRQDTNVQRRPHRRVLDHADLLPPVDKDGHHVIEGAVVSGAQHIQSLLEVDNVARGNTSSLLLRVVAKILGH